MSLFQGFCFVTNKLHIDVARREWEKRTNNGIIDYIVVTGLPRDALVEWYVWAHRANNTFQCKYIATLFIRQ